MRACRGQKRGVARNEQLRGSQTPTETAPRRPAQPYARTDRKCVMRAVGTKVQRRR